MSVGRLTSDAPLVVGGTGGSGTRLVVQMLRAAGVDMGGEVNASEDALAFVPLYDAYINPLLLDEPIDRAQFAADLAAAIRRHRAGSTASPWGWKNPRSIYLLPLLDEVLPGLRFVHVIRHGMDMASSGNQNQLLAHGRAVLGDALERMAPPVASALLWQRVNDAAARYGARMGERYVRLRYEDVCENPDAALAPLLRALGLQRPVAGWPTVVVPPARWSALEPALRDALREQIGDALTRYGYSC